jgi:N-methylhydantoinase A/oxoprolinase/acetone carboxylase beta subunit
MAWQFRIDRGGTFTDIVARDRDDRAAASAGPASGGGFGRAG